MAFCVKCGSKLDDGAAFCTNCGAKVEEEVAVNEEVKEEVKEAVKEEAKAAAPNPTPNPAPAAPSVDVSEFKNKIKKLPKFVWGIVVVVIVAIIALSMLVSRMKHTIDLNDYLDVQFTGYETIGKCEADWSEDFWEGFYDKAAKVPSSSSYDTMIKKLKFEVEPAEGLSNGDKVKVKWKVDAKYFKKHYGLIVKADDKTHKVDGLEEVDTFNPFDGIKVTFSGIEGEGRADYEVTSEDPIYSDFDFYIDSSYDLSSGDTVTVELQMKGAYGEDEIIDKCAEKYGEVPTEFSTKLKVEGLGKYVTKASELTEKNLAPLLRTAEDALTEETTSYGWEDGASMGNKKFIGSYVLTEKNHGNNMVYLVYEVTANMEKDGKTDSCTYYTYVQFHDVSINEDGELGCDTSYHSRPSSFTYTSSIKDGYWTQRYYFDGYETITKLNDDIVTGNLARYDSDTNVSVNTATPDDATAEDAETTEEDSQE